MTIDAPPPSGPPVYPAGPPPWMVAPRRPVDGISIASFVCALTGCAAPLAIGFGIAGLVRTRQGLRRGRWAAVIGLVIGTLVSALMITAAVFLVVTSADDLELSQARAGQCVDFDWSDTPSATSCHQDHDAEIMWVGQLNDGLVKAWNRSEYVDDFCFDRPVASVYPKAYAIPTIDVDYAIDTFSGEAKVGAWMVCYLTSTGGKLSAPIAELADPSNAV